MRYFALIAAPLVSELTVRRNHDRSNMFNVIAILNYTGGGVIQFFAVSYRKIGATATWLPIERNFIAKAVDDSLLVWSANVVDDVFHDTGTGIELRVQAVNSYGYISNSMDQREEIGKLQKP